MIRENRKRVMATLSAMTAALIMCFGAMSLDAQPIPWNPPCTATKVVNVSGCVATLSVRTNVGVFTITLGPGGSGPLVFPAGSIVVGIFTQAGTFVPVVSPGPAVIPPPAPPGRTAAAWVSNVTLGPAGCCYDIYFDQTTPPGCYIWLLPSAAPPPCIP
jgi:hypothetical protein